MQIISDMYMHRYTMHCINADNLCMYIYVSIYINIDKNKHFTKGYAHSSN